MPENNQPAPRPRGRPRLVTPSARMKITVDITPETYGKLVKIRAKEGISFGRIIDRSVVLVKKS